LAREQGVHLTDDYQIIDEQSGGVWDSSKKRLQPMTQAEIASLRIWTPEQMDQRIVRFASLPWSGTALLDSVLPGCGAQLAPVIGLGLSQDRNHVAQVSNAHGFSIEWLKIPSGGSVSLHRLSAKQLITVTQGAVAIDIANFIENTDDVITNTSYVATNIIVNGNSNGWDTYAMPADVWRTLRNVGDSEAVVLLMMPGDARKPIEWAPQVQQAAAAAGYCLDANGYIGLKKFIDRSQR
jgi:quercetin dioxygenase-like cupin family protein